MRGSVAMVAQEITSASRTAASRSSTAEIVNPLKLEVGGQPAGALLTLRFQIMTLPDGRAESPNAP